MATIPETSTSQADSEYANRHGCQLPPELPKRRPLGIDRIKELWDSNAEGRLLAFLCSIAKDYEPRNNLYQYLLIGPRAYHILHSMNVGSLLLTNFAGYSFGCRPAVFAPLLGKGIFTQEGTAWKHSRELLRKQFVRTQDQNLDHFCEHVDNLIACMPADGKVDLQPLFFSLTLDTATALRFGKSVYSLRSDIDQTLENKEFAHNLNIAQEGLAKRFRLAPFHFLYSPPKFRRACRTVHHFVERYIQEKRLFQTGATESAAEEDRSRLLVRHEAVMSRLRREVVDVMGSLTYPSRQEIRQMPFLACAVKESLRFYPSVPLNNREAIRTTVLPTGGGLDGNSLIMVRKGKLVVFSQYVNSRRKNVFGLDADDFRPERWETGKLDDAGWAFFPFNGGPRRCLGEDFALMETSHTIVRLLQAFPVIMLFDGAPVEPVGTERQTLTLVLSSADGCKGTVGAA